MTKPLFQMTLPESRIFVLASGKELGASVAVKVYSDDIGFDGDCPEDIAAFERGDFGMYLVEVSARFDGDLEGTDILGGVCLNEYSNTASILEVVEEHDMINTALSELSRKVDRILGYVNS